MVDKWLVPVLSAPVRQPVNIAWRSDCSPTLPYLTHKEKYIQHIRSETAFQCQICAETVLNFGGSGVKSKRPRCKISAVQV